MVAASFLSPVNKFSPAKGLNLWFLGIMMRRGHLNIFHVAKISYLYFIAQKIHFQKKTQVYYNFQ